MTSEGELSIRRQCALLGLSRSTLRADRAAPSEDELSLRAHIAELRVRHPNYGSRRLVTALLLEGKTVNRKRVQRLLRLGPSNDR